MFRVRGPVLLALAVSLLFHGLVMVWLLGGLNWDVSELVPLPDTPPPVVSVTVQTRPRLPKPSALKSDPPPEQAQAQGPQDPNGLSAPTRNLTRDVGRPEPGIIQLEGYLGVYAQDARPLGRGEITVAYPEANRYDITLRARAERWLALIFRGDVILRSEGRLTEQGLVPERFQQQAPNRPAQESRFDWVQQTALLKSDGDPQPLPIGLQDRISVAFQLAFWAESQPSGLPAGTRRQIPLAGRDKVTELFFESQGQEDLVLPGGILVSALKLSSDPFQSKRAGRVEVWLDPTDGHLPVRILYSEPSGRALDFLALRQPN